jgi:hypothetical protein
LYVLPFCPKKGRKDLLWKPLKIKAMHGHDPIRQVDKA